MSETNNAAPTVETSQVESTEGQENQQPQEGQQQPQPTAKRKVKYRADNQEFEEELSDDEIANRLSLARGAHRRMQESAMTKKQVEQFITRLREDPMSILGDERIMGQKKFRELAEKVILSQIEEESLSPQEKEQKERDKRLSDYERKEKEQREQEQQAQEQRLQQHYVQDLEKTITETLQSSDLPRNGRSVARMAKYLDLQLKYPERIGDLTPQMLAEKVKEDITEDLKIILKTATAEQILSMFGEDIANKIRKHDLSKFQSKNPTPVRAQPQQEEAPKKMTQREYDEYLRNKFKK